jgi:hypothetical protein
MYPADMRFNDFIPGVFLLYAEDETLYLDHSDNVDLWLQKQAVIERLGDEGFSRIGFIKNGSPVVRAAIVEDLKPVVSPKLEAL